MRSAAARTLSSAIGERMRKLREQRGLRQEDVAQAARGLGFRWTRSAIAKLEAGHRRLSAAELLMLADMINFTALGAQPERRGEVVELADLLPGDGWVILTNQSRVLSRALQMFLRGQLANVTTTDLDVPMLRKVRGRGQQALAGLHRTLVERAAIVDAVWPEATDLDVTAAATEAAGEAEQKAARRLGVPAFAIALEARHRWQRSLSAERDHRVTAQAPGREPRRLQAIRGHVSRVLLAELRSLPGRLPEIYVRQPHTSPDRAGCALMNKKAR